jgi:hypothetical protein
MEASGQDSRFRWPNIPPMDHASWTIRILFFLFAAAVLGRIRAAKRGKQIFIRRIRGIDALEEAVGRATEMGRPIMFVPGTAGFDNMATPAGLQVLEYVAKNTARYHVRMIVPCYVPVVLPVVKNIYEQACREVDRTEVYNSDDIRYYSDNQSAFAAAAAGTMIREQVAACFYFGSFGFESLLLAETGQRIGAIQVAATNDTFQIPFFLCACDYTLIGEELFAASAYLGRQPTQLGSTSGQDIGKLLVCFMIIVGSIAAFAADSSGFSWALGLFSR